MRFYTKYRRKSRYRIRLKGIIVLFWMLQIIFILFVLLLFLRVRLRKFSILVTATTVRKAKGTIYIFSWINSIDYYLWWLCAWVVLTGELVSKVALMLCNSESK